MKRLLAALALLLVGLLLAGLNLGLAQSGKVEGAVQGAVESGQRVHVIVTLVDPVPVQAPSAQRAAAVQQTANAVLASLSGSDFVLGYQYSYVPAISGSLGASGLAALAANPLVRYVQLDLPGGANTAQSVPAIGADVVHNTYGITGAGVRVAVLDTGIDTDHPDLSSDIIGQHCFTGGSGSSAPSCPPGSTATGTSAEDANGHGTNVSGIITSDGVVSSVGFAPGAKIYAIRVLDQSSRGWVSDWLAALNWIIANQSTLHINVINMSLGTDTVYTSTCDAAQPAMASAFAQLVQNDAISVTVSSGNAGWSTAVAAPACISTVIAVGATYDSDLGRIPGSGTWRTLFGSSWPSCFDDPATLARITCFTNSSSILDLVAPGVWITSSGMGGGLSTYAGTSQAAPTVAGVIALMLQNRPELNPSQIEAILKGTGDQVIDPRNGLTFPRVNALAAVDAVLPPPTVLLAPTGITNNTQPSLQWKSIPGVTSYTVWLNRADGSHVLDQSYMQAAACSGATCSATVGVALSPGDYQWWVQTFSPVGGNGDWSAEGDFAVMFHSTMTTPAPSQILPPQATEEAEATHAASPPGDLDGGAPSP